MSSLNVFEVAGSVAGIAGISLVVFYFLFKTIIKNILPDLTRNAKKNIVILMLFMVWSVTIIGITTWIYASTINDGGQQPEIKNDTVATEKEAQLSLSYVGTIVLSNALTADNAIKIPEGVGFDYAEAPPDRNIINGQCDLYEKAALWMSFNKNKPYYKTISDGKIKISLNDLDSQLDKATFKITINEEFTTKEYTFVLGKHQTRVFSFQGCNYEFSYKGMTRRDMGLQYWFKTRYIAHYEILPMRV